jgi:hypothetical protein
MQGSKSLGVKTPDPEVFVYRSAKTMYSGVLSFFAGNVCKSSCLSLKAIVLRPAQKGTFSLILDTYLRF